MSKKFPNNVEERLLRQATPEIERYPFADLTPQLTPFIPSWDKLRLFNNTVVEANVLYLNPDTKLPNNADDRSNRLGRWERYYTMSIYLGKLVVGGWPTEPDFKQMGEFVEMLIGEGLVVGRLGPPVSIPLARGSGAPPVWIPRSKLVDGKTVMQWHRTDTKVAVCSMHAPTLCGQLEGAMVLGFPQALPALGEEQLKDACPSCLQHDKNGTSEHEPTPERHMLLCCLFPSLELMIQLKDSAQAPQAYLNERFGFDYFTEEGALPNEWPEVRS